MSRYILIGVRDDLIGRRYDIYIGECYHLAGTFDTSGGREFNQQLSRAELEIINIQLVTLTDADEQAIADKEVDADIVARWDIDENNPGTIMIA